MNSKFDKIYTDGEIIFYFSYLEWDSQFFNKESYFLNIAKSQLGVSDIIKAKLLTDLKGCFLTIKLSTEIDDDILFFLQECGFYYVDTEVLLEYTKNDNSFYNDTITIKQKKSNIDLPYDELGSTFSLTRFHTDINIDNTLADDLWIQYLKNYTITSNRYMFTAEINNQIIGVILVNLNENVATLFYVAVLKEYSGKGIGKSLMHYVLNSFDKYIIRTETQVKNLNALNYYIRSGLNKINNTLTVLHRW